MTADLGGMTDDEFDDFLLTRICAAYGVPPAVIAMTEANFYAWLTSPADERGDDDDDQV